MDVYHENPGFVENERQPIVQPCFDVNALSSDLKPKIPVKVKLICPLRARFRDFIDRPTRSDVLAHQPTEFFERHISEFTPNPAVCLLSQFELDEPCETPIAQSINIRG